MDKAEALKIIKEFKTGRLKSFKKRSEAEEYAKTGFEETLCNNNSSTVPVAIPVVEEKSSNFKAPRSQELVGFRKLIKDGDLYAVKTTLWGNPRYLIGSGDTPAILQVIYHIYYYFQMFYISERTIKLYSLIFDRKGVVTMHCILQSEQTNQTCVS